jgi:hypothetical protein
MDGAHRREKGPAHCSMFRTAQGWPTPCPSCKLDGAPNRAHHGAQKMFPSTKMLPPTQDLEPGSDCVCSKAGISFRAMESAATIPHAHGEHCADEAWADDEGG